MDGSMDVRTDDGWGYLILFLFVVYAESPAEFFAENKNIAGFDNVSCVFLFSFFFYFFNFSFWNLVFLYFVVILLYKELQLGGR